jgi:hypothetical protein
LKFSVRLFANDHDLVVDEAGAVMQEGPEPLLESFETNVPRERGLGKSSARCQGERRQGSRDDQRLQGHRRNCS